MIKLNVKIKDLDKFQRSLKRFPKELERQLGIAMKKSILLIEAKAKPITPVDTGRLRASIKPDFIRPMESMISPHTDYAVYVHEGTRYMRARPFMAQGVEKASPMIDVFFNGAVEKALMKSIY